mgnify:CR=1 FL=1
MGLTAEQLQASLDAIAATDSDMARALAAVGYPEPRIRERGYATMLRTIVGQQVSAKAAAAVYARVEALLGEGDPAYEHLCTTTPLKELRERGEDNGLTVFLRDLAAAV